MVNTDNLRKINDKMSENINGSLEHLDNLSVESERISNVFYDAENILNDLDREFSQKTGIYNKKDLSLLFIATGMLCAKWLIMGQKLPLDFDFKYELTPNDERLTAKQGDKFAENNLKNKRDEKFNKIKNQMDKSESTQRTLNQILFGCVPYDAFHRNDDIVLPLKLYGKNHRSYTLGHDPVWGWVFGTINIISRSVTLKYPTLPTYDVSEHGNIIINESDIFTEVGKTIRSVATDNRRLPAAIFRQSQHFISDKFTKSGLPIPFISAEKAQELIEKGWNASEVENAIKKFMEKSAKFTGTVLLQFSLSFLINLIIKVVHLMLYNEEKDGNIEMYEVRTRKILSVANVISSSSNILISSGIAIGGENILKGAELLDIGGYIETIHRLVSDTKFINEIKREYILNNFEDKIFDNDNNFEWLYNNGGN